MPVAIPTCRNVELIPDAIPARAGSTTPTAVDASGTLTSPAPTPATIRPGSRWVQSELASSPRISSRPGADQREPRADEQARRHLRGEAPGDPRRQEDRAGQREEAHAGLRGRVAEHVLEVEDEEGQHREQRGRDRERRREAADERRVAQQREVEHRRALDLLGDDEDAEQERRAAEAGDDQGRPPALGVAADQAEDERGQRAAERDEADPVGPPGARLARLVDAQQRDRHRGDADRYVHEEDPAPRQAAGDHATEHRADCHRDARHCAEHAERDPAFTCRGTRARAAPARWRT